MALVGGMVSASRRFCPYRKQPKPELDVDECIIRLRCKARFYQGDEIALLDVREAGESGEGRPLLAINLPYSVLEARAITLLPSTTTPIVVMDDGNDDDRAARAAAGWRHKGMSASWMAGWPRGRRLAMWSTRGLTSQARYLASCWNTHAIPRTSTPKNSTKCNAQTHHPSSSTGARPRTSTHEHSRRHLLSQRRVGPARHQYGEGRTDNCCSARGVRAVSLARKPSLISVFPIGWLRC